MEYSNWFIFALISAVLSAGAAVSQKRVLKNLDPLLFSFLLSAFTFVLTLPFLSLVKWDMLTPLSTAVLFFKCFLGAIAFYFVMSGLKKLYISLSLPILVLTPAVVAVFAFFLLGETLTLLQIGGILFMLGGIYVVQLDRSVKFYKPFSYLLKLDGVPYILGALGIFSATSILDKWILNQFRFPPFTFLFYQQLCFILLYLFMMGWKRVSINEITFAFKKRWKWLLLIALFTIGYRLSYIYAVKGGAVALALTVKRTSVFMATILGGTLFKEPWILRKSIAVVVMLIGAGVLLMANSF